MEKLNLTQEWDKVFPKSDKVDHKKVTFHNRYFSETAYSKLTGDNKELLMIPDANHTDLYDQMDVIPFEKLKAFFEE